MLRNCIDLHVELVVIWNQDTENFEETIIFFFVIGSGLAIVLLGLAHFIRFTPDGT